MHAVQDGFPPLYLLWPYALCRTTSPPLASRMCAAPCGASLARLLRRSSRSSTPCRSPPPPSHRCTPPHCAHAAYALRTHCICTAHTLHMHCAHAAYALRMHCACTAHAHALHMHCTCTAHARAQVHAATLRASGQRVVLKLQHRGISALMARDMIAARRITSFVRRFAPSFGVLHTVLVAWEAEMVRALKLQYLAPPQYPHMPSPTFPSPCTPLHPLTPPYAPLPGARNRAFAGGGCHGWCIDA